MPWLYGPNIPDLFGRTAELVDKILRGAKPAGLPVEQPTKFEFVVNLKTARVIGLDGTARSSRSHQRGDRVMSACGTSPADKSKMIE
jgi:ABC-type uncharacterized transport system substrate-binding protein